MNLSARSFVRGAWFVARGDLGHMLRRRETILWVFVMPALFFYFIGTVTGGMAAGPNRRETLAVRGAEQGGFLVEELMRRLREQQFDIVKPESEEAFRTFERRLTIPKPPDSTFTEAVLAGRQQLVT